MAEKKVTEGRKGMGQLSTKKGRPSKTDPARTSAAVTAAPDLRRSLRRRRCLRYTLDYDDYMEEEDDDEPEDDDDDDEDRIRAKKLKLVLKLPTFRKGRSQTAAAREMHAPSPARTASGSSSENAPPKRRRIDGGGVLGGDGGCSMEEEEEDEYRYEMDSGDEARKDLGGSVSAPASVHKFCDLQSTPSDSSSDLPLPDKKSLELILDKLQKKDIYGVYADPVDPEELPDYHDIIEHPMDFATVRKKLQNGSYSVLKEFESDVYLICSNAMQYNTSDTIYYKQARSIQELARKKFERMKIDIGISEREKTSQKVILDSSVNKKMCKPACLTFQEPVGSDFSSGATLAIAADTQNVFNTCQASFDRHNCVNVAVEGNASIIDSNYEKPYELLPGRGICQSKFGRKSATVEDNPRATYNISNGPKEETVFSTFEAEPKQLVPVGLHSEYSYARSLSMYSATLGSDAWKASASRIQQALPPGFKFGRGWVGEYELPLSSLIIPEPPPPPPSPPPPVVDTRNNGKIPVSITDPPVMKPPVFAAFHGNSRVDDKPPLHNEELSNYFKKQKQFHNGIAAPKQQQQLTNGMVTPGHDQSYSTQLSNRMMTPGRDQSTEYRMPQPPNETLTPGNDQSTKYTKQLSANGTVTRGNNLSAEYNKQQKFIRQRQFSNGMTTSGQPGQPGQPGQDQSTKSNKQRPTNGPATHQHDDSTEYKQQKHPNGGVTHGHDMSVKFSRQRQFPANGIATSEHDQLYNNLHHNLNGTDISTEMPRLDRSHISADSLYNPVRSQPIHRPIHNSPSQAAIFQQTAKTAADTDTWRFQPPTGMWQSVGEKTGRKPEMSPPDLNIGYQWLGPPTGVLLDSQQPDLALQL